MLDSGRDELGLTISGASSAIIVPVRSKDMLLNRLAEAIHSGLLKAGDKLMTEREIATGSGLARSTVRDVLAELERAGLIHRQVGRGTFVTGDGAAPKSGSAAPGTARFSPAELIEFRQVLEPGLAELIVLKASEAELEAIRSLSSAGRAVEDWRHGEEVDGAFHAKLYETTHNATIRMIGLHVRTARAQPSWLMIKKSNFSRESWAFYQSEHEAIAEALCERDTVRARDLLRRHLLDVRAGWAL